MKKFEKHNISISLSAVNNFLDAMDDKSCTPEQSAKIANELIDSMRKARALLKKGIDAKNLTVCIGKGCHVDPKDLQKFIERKISRVTIYRAKKDTRHMPLYMKHTPQFYIDNAPVPKPGARNKPPRKPQKSA